MINIDLYSQIYSMLDTVSPFLFDCGQLCHSICCHTESFPLEDKPYLFFLPGEDKIHNKSDSWLTWYELNREDYIFPSSWGKSVIAARCSGPNNCNRNMRPIQCRTFPLTPHFTQKGKLELVYYDSYLPYKCPIIAKKLLLSNSFLEKTFEAWKLLIQEKSIHEFIEIDSRCRYRFWHRYKAAIK